MTKPPIKSGRYTLARGPLALYTCMPCGLCIISGSSNRVNTKNQAFIIIIVVVIYLPIYLLLLIFNLLDRLAPPRKRRKPTSPAT